MDSLKKKTVKGGLFLTITNIFNQFIAVILNIVLARLLLAEDFGLIALSTTYIGFITIFLSIGFGSAIIHFNNATKSNISTLYYLNIIVALFTFLIIYFTASYAASFYGDKELENIVKWSSLSILITPFFITHLKIFERDLEFKRIGLIVVLSSIFSAICAIVAVLNDFGVYALVVQALSLTFFKLVFVMYYSNWKPNKYFKVREVNYMIWYAVKYRMSQGALYFERNVDYLILGKIFTSTILGYYAFSYNIMYTPVKRISNIFNDILFPSLSKLKNDREKIIRAYFQSKQLVAMVAFPIMTLVAFNAEIIISFVFGDKWIEAIPILKILCFAGAFQSISQFGNAIFNSIGRPEKSLYIAIARSFMTVAAIIGGSYYGILAVAYLLLLTKILNWFIVLIAIRLEISYEFYSIWKYLKGTIFCIIGLSISEVIFENNLYFDISSLLELVIQIFLALVIIHSFYKKVIRDLITVIGHKTNVNT